MSEKPVLNQVIRPFDMQKLQKSVTCRPAIGCTWFIYFPPTNSRPARYRFLPWTNKVSRCRKALFLMPLFSCRLKEEKVKLSEITIKKEVNRVRNETKVLMDQSLETDEDILSQKPVKPISYFLFYTHSTEVSFFSTIYFT